MHGGGNTSAKMEVENLFGEKEEVLYVKGSGWDLATIEKQGFSPVRLDVLLKMAKLERLSDREMVKVQRSAMLDPNAPNPSVEAVLHAVIPFRFVDHTHADAVVALTNTPAGQSIIEELYGNRILIIPYVMPGFLLAKEIYRRTHNLDWSGLEGMILLHHGVFTFGDDAKTSYERMIDLVTIAELHLQQNKVDASIKKKNPTPIDLVLLAQIRKQVGALRGGAGIARVTDTEEACGFSILENARQLTEKGTLTPDHVIRTKPRPLWMDRPDALDAFVQEYKAYFKRHCSENLQCLDLAPRWAVWKGIGTLAFGRSLKEACVIEDINRHTLAAIQWAEHFGGWSTISEKDLFDMEYWELEQAKLKRKGSSPPLQGKIAIVTGAASGIGLACVHELLKQGAVVGAFDIDPKVDAAFSDKRVCPLVVDVTVPKAVQSAIDTVVRNFGGLDLLVSNAGVFPPSHTLEQMDEKLWQQSLEVNVTGHQNVLKASIPYLKHGFDPAILIVASKNVLAPGVGAGAYSVAKAGLTQLARIAALELAASKIRVYTLHPHAVFDTAIWTDEVLEARAKHYNMTIDEYKMNNLLQVEIKSQDIAALICNLAGPLFSKMTGLQIPIDGGNARVI